MTGDDVRRLFDSLKGDDATAEFVETHISWVLLYGDEALKIKKPVDLGFADFSTLERRRRFCEDELRLNGRLAPEVYLEVLPIGGSPAAPRLGDQKGVFEYAVRMRRFSQDDLLVNVLQRGALTPEHVDRFARELAEFHARIPPTDPDAPYGRPEQVWAPVAVNFEVLAKSCDDESHRRRLDALAEWSRSEFERLESVFARRRERGFVRECHGDAHLRNAILVRDGADEHVVLFDGIDFSEELRWIDTMSDAAFAIMDLADRGRVDLAHRFRNAYLESSGDYEGLGVLTYYVVYRSLVRAKVAAIRRDQPGLSAEEVREITEELEDYLALAERVPRRDRPRLLITCGFSGSGKSTVAQRLVEDEGAIRIRSDVERKRMHAARSDVPLYSAEMTDDTYRRLADLCRAILETQHSVVVDATFLERDRRESFRRLAESCCVPFFVVHVTAPHERLRERVAARTAAGTDVSDADVAVLERQRAAWGGFGPDERDVMAVDTEDPASMERLRESLRSPATT